MTDTTRIPLHAWGLLWPRRIHHNLRRAEAAGLVEGAPNLWQVTLGVLRMWHRMLFRFDSVGTCAQHPARPSLRARILQYRPLRFPFLWAERAVAPTDFSGLASSEERIVRHLLGAHHDANQFAYDLELLSIHPGGLERLLEQAREVAVADTPRARWLRDLTVYERYHEKLVEAVEHAVEHGVRFEGEETDDPDISLSGYLRWCTRQPATPGETLEALRRGRYTVAEGVRA